MLRLISVYDHHQGVLIRVYLVIFRLGFGKNYIVCYAVVWQYVIGVVCVMFAVSSATEHGEQYTFHTYDMVSHHFVTCNDVVFTES